MDQELGSASDDRLRRPVLGGKSLTTEDRPASIIPRRSRAGVRISIGPGGPAFRATRLRISGWSICIRLTSRQQVPHARIHKSTEHARLTPVFGTSCPPRGLSGWLRDIGYRYSEGRMARWLTLMAADRVDVVESVVDDLVTLRGPNLVRETGLRTEWQYNRSGFITKAAVVGLSALAAYVVLSRRRD